jgi:hypothetical protein
MARAALPGAVKEKPEKLEVEEKKKPKRRGPKRLNRMFGLPIREAKDPLTIPLLQVDVDAAEEVKPGDVNDEENFLSCVIAQAVTRAAGAEHVAIMRRYAYVAFPGDGYTNRYSISDKARNTLERWDRGEEVDTEVALVLRAVPKSQTRAASRKSVREFARRHPEYYRNRRKTDRMTDRKQSPSDPRRGVVRHGNLVKWSS